MNFLIRVFLYIIIALNLTGCFINTTLTALSDANSPKLDSQPGVPALPGSPVPVPTTPNTTNPSGKITLDVFDSTLFETGFGFQGESKGISFAKSATGNLYVVETVSFNYSFLFSTLWMVRKSTDNGLTWTIIDRFQYAPGWSTSGYGVVVDSSENVFILGRGTNSSNQLRVIIRKGSNGGTSWSTYEDYAPSIVYSELTITSFLIDSQDRIFYSFYLTDWGSGSPVYTSEVRRFNTGVTSSTKVTDLNFVNPVADSFLATNLARDSSDNIYCSGYIIDHTGLEFKWALIRSTDHGQSWTTLSNTSNPYPLSMNSSSMLFIDNTGNIFAGGTNMSDNNWNIYRSTNLGTSWTLVDNFSSGFPADEVIGILQDGAGNLYGYGSTANKSNLIVRKSTNGGATWAALYSHINPSYDKLYAYSGLVVSGDIFIIGNGQRNGSIQLNGSVLIKSSNMGGSWTEIKNYAAPLSIAESNGTVSSDFQTMYAVGTSISSSKVGTWIVKKTSDKGSNWSVVDIYTLEPSHNSEARKAVIDSLGNIFVGGYGFDSSSILHWIVRKSSDGGVVWTTVDDYTLSAGYSAEVFDLHFANGAIYAVGTATDSTNVAHSIIRKSSNAGLSWTTAFDFNLDLTMDSGANSMTHCPDGKLYAIGYGIDSAWAVHWIVNRSSDSGASWQVVDDFTNAIGVDSLGLSAVCSSTGAVYTIGEGWDASWNYKSWITRKSNDSGSTWTTIDSFNRFPNEDSSGTSIQLDGNGNLFASGVGNQSKWRIGIIRKSTDNGSTWTIEDESATQHNSMSDEMSGDYRSLDKCFEGHVCLAGSSQLFTGFRTWVIKMIN